MIEVEDKVTEVTHRVRPNVNHSTCVSVVNAHSNLVVSRDTWPALKEAIETTFRQMEAKPLLQHSDRDRAESLILLSLKGDYMSPEILIGLLDALERGYV